MLFVRNNTIIIDRGISPTAAKQRQSYDLASERVLLWIDLSRVPRDAAIYDARLIIPVIGPVGRGVDLRVGRIARAWDPLLASWTHRTERDEWAQPGGLEGFDFTPWVATAAAVPAGTTTATPVHVAFDVTSDVQAFQRSGARPGWIIGGDARVGAARNVQLPSAPALAVKYSGDKTVAVLAGLTSGGI